MNRVLSFAVVTMSAVIMTSSRVEAAVVDITQGSTIGYTMTDGNTYVIQNSVSFSNTTAGGSGISVEDGATVVVYVPTGVALTATGANGSGQTGGGAGIRVPETSTLVITGEGTVNASGGNAGDGGDGGDGEEGYKRTRYLGDGSTYQIWYSGNSGAGGRGGGGAGAGIGGSGGLGGNCGYCNIYSKEGKSGGDGASMGNVYILGSMKINAYVGLSGVAGACGHKMSTYSSGGGGGGGAGSSPTYSIGGGGSAGGGGGAGDFGDGHGSFQGGKGGGSATNAGQSAGDGPNGGAAGNEGGAGILYVSPTATIYVERETLSTTTHVAAQHTVMLDVKGGVLSSTASSIVATLGCEFLQDIPVPHKGVARFCGWAYDQDGILMATSVYTMPSNTILYAVWEPLQPVFTPESGTTFDNSLSVSISCQADGATIHYTTDGSEPTVNSPVYRRFRINGRTTVKAIAEEDGLLSDVVMAEYALGQCDDPVIMPTDGSTFNWAGEQVSIGWQGADGVLRYTTDGSDPTPESPVYEGPFMISDSTIVKAKAFGGQFFDSAIVTANITRVWTDVATPQIDAANSFTGSKTKVEILCATEGTTIRYTLDGSEPNSHSTKYTGPFYVTDSCTVKAYAAKYDYRDSTVVTQEIVKAWGIGDTMGKSDHGFTTDGTGGVDWTRVVDATAPNGEAMKSGAITHNQQSVLETKVTGPGTLTFSWRTSCEDSGGQYDWDHAEFAVDGAVLLKRDGINSWANESVRIESDGEHTITWTYKKDDVESDGDDAIYVAGYGWVSDYTETKTTEVPVPYAWLLQNDPEIVDEFDAYESAAKATAANGHNKVWECYVTGISPTNEMARFTAKIELKDGGPVVMWEPDLNTNGVIRTYKVYGSETLENGGDWQYPTNSLHRFFRVTVEMP